MFRAQTYEIIVHIYQKSDKESKGSEVFVCQTMKLRSFPTNLGKKMEPRMSLQNLPVQYLEEGSYH